MSDAHIELRYDEQARSAMLVYPNGRELKLSNVTRQQAENFHARHAAEFGRRNLCLETPSDTVTRIGGSHG